MLSSSAELSSSRGLSCDAFRVPFPLGGFSPQSFRDVRLSARERAFRALRPEGAAFIPLASGDGVALCTVDGGGYAGGEDGRPDSGGGRSLTCPPRGEGGSFRLFGAKRYP
jgi:hypothetical protein